MRIFISIFFCCFSCFFAMAQPRMAFTRLHTQDGTGLASNHVYSVYQDSKGFVWVGTANGLQRFDGSKFISFTTHKPGSDRLPVAGVRQIIEAGEGKMILYLMGVREFGLFDPATFTYKKIKLQTEKAIPPRAEFRIWKTREGEIFLTVLHYGILHYNKGKGAFMDDHYFTLPDRWLPSITGQFDDTLQNRIWIGCDSGLCVYDKHSKQIWYAKNNPKQLSILYQTLLQENVTSVYIDRQKRNWFIGWSSKGQFKYCFDSTGTYHLIKDTAGLHTGPVGYTEYVHFFETRSGGFWVYGMSVLFSWDNQLQRFNFHKSDNRNDEVSINYESVNQIFEDRDGSIWIATDRGLYITSVSNENLSVTNLLFSSEKENVSITDILELPNEDIWFTSWATGVKSVDQYFQPIANAVYQNPPPTHWPAKLKGSVKLTWTMCRESATNKVWIGCNSGVLLEHDPINKTTRYHHPEIFNNSTIRFIAEDKAGQLWMGTQGGRLIKYRNNEFTLVKEIGTIIYKIFFDKQGWMWLATHEKGLYAIQPVTGELLQHYTASDSPNGLFANTGYDIEQLNDSIIIYGAGALNFINKKRKTVEQLTYEEGLPSNNVIRLRMDRSGFLWIITANGLCRYNPGNKRITSYGKKDGIVFAEQANVADYACKNGNIIFGGSNMVIMFHPGAFTNNSAPPEVRITDFKLLDQFIPVDSLLLMPAIKLQHFQNSFSINFSALSFMQSNKLTYYYMMEGIDVGWKKAELGNQENYSLLPPGKYVFKVYCENLEGVRSLKTTTLNILIKPPFWRTWWFRLSILFLIVLIIFDLHNARVKRLLAVEKLRNKVARDLHDDMGSTLSTINILSAMAKTKMATDAVKSSEYLSKITDNSQRMMEAMDDIVWSIKPSNDSMQKITARMREFATNVLEAKDIELKFQVEEQVYDEKLNMENRRDFFLVFKEAINNAAKYSRASIVEVFIHIKAGKLLLVVKDNGIGFDVKNANEGNGLGNMQKRCESMNGQVSIQSAKDKGTEVSIKIPIK